MENVVYYITQGSTEFTPDVLVRLFVFGLILEGIFAVLSSMLGGLKK